MSLSRRVWDRADESSERAASIVVARLSRDDLAPSSAVRHPVIPNLMRSAGDGRGEYAILSATRIFCHPDGNIFVRRVDAR